MMDLKDEDIENCSEDMKGMVHVLRRQGYKWPNKDVYRRMFMGIVSSHYEEHWREEDLKIMPRPHGKVECFFVNLCFSVW